MHGATHFCGFKLGGVELWNVKHQILSGGTVREAYVATFYVFKIENRGIQQHTDSFWHAYGEWTTLWANPSINLQKHRSIIFSCLYFQGLRCHSEDPPTCSISTKQPQYTTTAGAIIQTFFFFFSPSDVGVQVTSWGYFSSKSRKESVPLTFPHILWLFKGA